MEMANSRGAKGHPCGTPASGNFSVKRPLKWTFEILLLIIPANREIVAGPKPRVKSVEQETVFQLVISFLKIKFQ